MFIKDYFILDNALKDPEKFLDCGKSKTYYTKEDHDVPGVAIKRNANELPGGDWGGFRTQNLIEEDPALAKEFNDSFSYRIFDFDVQPIVSLHYQLTTKKMDEAYPPELRWHKDVNVLFAGVVYLSKRPAEDSGTQIITPNNKIVTLKNKFNRLVLYKGFLLHRVQGFFGSSIEDCRNTLVFFIHSAAFSVKGNVAEPG